MKKKVRIVLEVIIIVVLVFVYAHIAKVHSIYNKDIDPSEYGNIMEEESTILEERFVTQEETLDGIRIKGVENGDISKVYIGYSLTNVASGKKVADGEVNAKESMNGRFYELPFETVTECKGKEYILSVWQRSEDNQSNVSFSFERQTERGTALSIDGNDTEGTLIVKTVTDRFDMETFFVVLVFVAYIVAFMKLLYKLFK